MTNRYYNLIGTKEYSQIHNVSLRTAQRAIAKLPGAVKSTGNRWIAPIPSTQYAQALHVSAKTARRRGQAASSPGQATQAVQGTLRARAAQSYYQLLIGGGTAKPPSYKTITNRLRHATRGQLRRVEKLNTTPDYFDDDWLGDDNLSILFYR